MQCQGEYGQPGISVTQQGSGISVLKGDQECWRQLQEQEAGVGEVCCEEV
jgi:hypothetical protein